MEAVNSFGDIVDDYSSSMHNTVAYGNLTSNFSKDYYTEPYGGFVNNILFGNRSKAPHTLLFGHAYFNNINTKLWPDQDPLSIGGTTNISKTCDRAFVTGLTFKLCAFNVNPVTISMRCSSGNTIAVNKDLCPAYNNPRHNFMFQCPEKHLICGFKKFIPANANGFNLGQLFGYRHTYMCCPVTFPVDSRCPGGVQLSAEPAKVNCIAVSGADTKCTTTESYGYSMDASTMNGSNVDTATASTFGFSEKDQRQHVATSMVKGTIETSSGAGNKIFGAELSLTVSAEISGGYSYTNDQTTEKTNSRMDSTSNAFSFDKAVNEELTNSTMTKTEYTIKDGQRTLFYDIVRICGDIRMISEDFVRILTPSVKCDATFDFEYIFGWNTFTTNPAGVKEFTFFGFGLEIENDTFVKPTERAVNWGLISLGVIEKFTESVQLSDNIYLPTYNFKNAPKTQWERSNNDISYNLTFNFVYPNVYRIYRLVGRCGRWRAITNSIWANVGINGVFKHTIAPPDPNFPFIEGYNFKLI